PYSKIERIETLDPSISLPEKIFGAPPAQDWCYYYQKISLARQQEDWSEAARLSDEAAQNGFQPRDKSEWIPVFEAYANTGRFESAAQVAKKMSKNPDMLLLFCSQIQGRADLPASYNYEYVFSTLCNTPR
ncbi:MAG: hypothetical protein PHQ36_09050, partial [Anaerolineales bacterium]|nr:hypothetical protein [Anaerolineales bacterium]